MHRTARYLPGPFPPCILEAQEQTWPPFMCQALGKENRAAKSTITVLKGSFEVS
jgi:hypothetical protein